MAYSTQVFAQGQENEGEGKEHAVDQGKSTDEEQLEARNTCLVSHTCVQLIMIYATICHCSCPRMSARPCHNVQYLDIPILLYNLCIIVENNSRGARPRL